MIRPSRREVAFGALASPLIACAAPARRVQFWATQSGAETFDGADGVGNPFATELIALMREKGLALPDMARALVARTRARSAGAQVPEVIGAAGDMRFSFTDAAKQSRVALILIFSDYSASDSAPSLPGAAADGRRVEKAFAEAGFKTSRVENATRVALPHVLAEFARVSAQADVAAIYSTGHGAQVAGVQYVILGDYIVAQGAGGLNRAAKWETIAAAARAKSLNLTIWAGCRNNPFA